MKEDVNIEELKEETRESRRPVGAGARGTGRADRARESLVIARLSWGR
ncbi:MAG: hypothetical protein K6G32_05875 [Prevotella sp.]|nr:hypothetical protein [Prevotella sp.]